MTIRHRPFPFGETNTNGRNDYKIISSDEPIATSRATRRLMKKLASKSKSKRRGVWTFY